MYDMKVGVELANRIRMTDEEGGEKEGIKGREIGSICTCMKMSLWGPPRCLVEFFPYKNKFRSPALMERTKYVMAILNGEPDRQSPGTRWLASLAKLERCKFGKSSCLKK